MHSEDYAWNRLKAIEFDKTFQTDEVLSGLHTFAFRDYKGEDVAGFRPLLLGNPQVKKALRQSLQAVRCMEFLKGNLEKFRLVFTDTAEHKKLPRF